MAPTLLIVSARANLAALVTGALVAAVCRTVGTPAQQCGRARGRGQGFSAGLGPERHG